MAARGVGWRRREPEGTVLYRVVLAEWATFVQRLEAGERAVPQFCVREVESFLRCGILDYGFARVHCDACGQDDVVAFSCKGRGFCPSCGTARMADTAAWLVDHVIPEVPVRQWVLSLPYRVRVLCAYDADVCGAVRRLLVRAVSGYYERAARRQGRPRPRAGAVAFVQRFDSGLRVNLHFHVLWLDGVYAHEPGSGRAEFCEPGEVTESDVARLVRAVRDRVLRWLRRSGKWVDEDGEAAADGDDAALLLGAAAMQGRAALGERALARDVRVGRGTRSEPFVKGPLCPEVDGERPPSWGPGLRAGAAAASSPIAQESRNCDPVRLPTARRRGGEASHRCAEFARDPRSSRRAHPFPASCALGTMSDDIGARRACGSS